MAARPSSQAVHLVYGNQTYLVEQRAAQITEAVLGPGANDFTLRRFDAEEMLWSGPAEALAAPLDAFEEACLSLPLLGERYLVRLDHAERLRAPARTAQTMARRLAELRVAPTVWEGRSAWALEADLLPGEANGAPVPVERWIAELSTRADGAVLLTPARDWERTRFIVATRGGRQAMGLKPFLRTIVKGNFAFAGDDEAEGAAAAPLGDGGATRLLERIERLIAHPPPGLTLLITARVARERDLARSLIEMVKRHGSIDKFITYEDYAPWQWVLSEAEKQGLRLERPAADLLIRVAGNDHAQLARELDKLSLLFPAGTRLDADRLAGALHAGAHGSLFGINERLAARDLSGALFLLERFLEESPREFPLLVGLLARFFRQLLLVHTLSRLSDADLGARLAVHPFIARRIRDQAERFTPRELERIIQELAALDLASRLHGHVAAPLFRDWMQAVCRGDYQRRGPRPALA